MDSYNYMHRPLQRGLPPAQPYLIHSIVLVLLLVLATANLLNPGGRTSRGGVEIDLLLT